MAEVDKAMQTLQNMWYMAVVNGLGMDKSSFMLLQSGTPLPYTTGELWQVIDSLPPKALTTVLSVGSLNSFYQNYGGLFSAVTAPDSDDFKRVMGDYLARWMDYKKTVTRSEIKEGDGWSGLFEFWANQHLPDNVAAKAISVFNKDKHNIVTGASDKYYKNIDTDHPFVPGTYPLYNIQIGDITGGATAHGPKKEIHVNSKTSSSDVSNTWAKGGVSGFFSIFSLGGNGNFSKTSSKFTSSDFTIDATFQHVVTIPTFKPGDWYNSALLSYARANRNVWSVGNPVTWESTFGPEGNLQRYIEQLVIVDGIEVIMTSDATYTAAEQMEINGQARGGIWPFFMANASGGHGSSVRFDDKGRMIVKTSSPVGSPAIFGANVKTFPA